ncbi:hypothetical protein FIBSPDRAFT_893790 [Athelia psychrophila]|uniref:Uncharacterized protein n=1 Tax=Athelia psychrophila TaxID=1759441 RepID=A0A166GQN6_9AGAM|nr:hypothetical protein FIBSPDRAFT_893790 [Fibularhizoctonia sp. CBS 109695]
MKRQSNWLLVTQAPLTESREGERRAQPPKRDARALFTYNTLRSTSRAALRIRLHGDNDKSVGMVSSTEDRTTMYAKPITQEELDNDKESTFERRSVLRRLQIGISMALLATRTDRSTTCWRLSKNQTQMSIFATRTRKRPQIQNRRFGLWRSESFWRALEHCQGRTPDTFVKSGSGEEADTHGKTSESTTRMRYPRKRTEQVMTDMLLATRSEDREKMNRRLDSAGTVVDAHVAGRCRSGVDEEIFEVDCKASEIINGNSKPGIEIRDSTEQAESA